MVNLTYPRKLIAFLLVRIAAQGYKPDLPIPTNKNKSTNPPPTLIKRIAATPERNIPLSQRTNILGNSQEILDENRKEKIKNNMQQDSIPFDTKISDPDAFPTLSVPYLNKYNKIENNCQESSDILQPTDNCTLVNPPENNLFNEESSYEPPKEDQENKIEVEDPLEENKENIKKEEVDISVNVSSTPTQNLQKRPASSQSTYSPKPKMLPKKKNKKSYKDKGIGVRAVHKIDKRTKSAIKFIKDLTK